MCIYPSFWFPTYPYPHPFNKKNLTFPSSSSNEAPPPVLQWVTWRTNGMAYLTRRELQVYPFPIHMVPSSCLVFSVVLFASLRKGKKKGGQNGFLCGNQPGKELWICTSFKWMVMIRLYLINAPQICIRSVPFALQGPKEIVKVTPFGLANGWNDALLLHYQWTINFINETSIQRRTKNSSWNLVQNLEEKNNRKTSCEKTSRNPFLNSHQITRLSYCGGVTSANHLSCDS